MSAVLKFEKILEPGKIGSVKTRNRIIKTGAQMNYWHYDDLHMNDTIKAFYGALARGGVGLLVVESPVIDYPLGARHKYWYRIDDDKYIGGLKELVSVIHSYGCPTFMQMVHFGPWQNPIFPNLEPVYEGPPVGASPVNLEIEHDFHRDLIRELSIPEILEIVDKFANAAVRARKAGFDGVEVNAGSSHLFHTFLSPFWNRRTDEYGGSQENRSRFLIQVIKEIKKKCGQDFPVSIILNGIEVGQAIGIDNKHCLTLEDSLGIAKLLEGAGADAIHVRNHWLGYHVGGFLTEHLFYPEPPVPLRQFPKEYYWKKRGAAANLILAGEMKKNLSIPVITVGRLDPVLGEKILREGRADFIAMTRRLFADPQLPNKIAAGRIEDIAPCTACGTCLDQSRSIKRHCRINAAMGSENYEIPKAQSVKKVVVIGGGPAGMEAARVAAIRGHKVTLFERSRSLGGILPVATFIKGTEIEDLPAIIRYFMVQIKKLNVELRLGKEFKSSILNEIQPDAVIVATGGKPVIPEITGINNKNVLSMPVLHHKIKCYLKYLNPRLLRWLTKFWMPVGKRVVIIGSGIHGCELAEFLIKRGRSVTIVDTAKSVGQGVVDFKLGLLMIWFRKKGVTIINKAKNIEITSKGVKLILQDGTAKYLDADTVIPALPLKPDLSVVNDLNGGNWEIYSIGDCKESGLIVDAISSGYYTALQI